MIARTLSFALALSGGLTAAQLPEFSQQYVQRMGGAVDALSTVIADFDASAVAAGLSRDAALNALQGSEFLDRRRADMTNTFKRHARLSTELAWLSSARPAQRAFRILRLPDRDLVGATYRAYRPAFPVTIDGALFGAGGFLTTGLLARGAGRLLRRRRLA